MSRKNRASETAGILAYRSVVPRTIADASSHCPSSPVERMPKRTTRTAAAGDCGEGAVDTPLAAREGAASCPALRTLAKAACMFERGASGSLERHQGRGWGGKGAARDLVASINLFSGVGGELEPRLTDLCPSLPLSLSLSLSPLSPSLSLSLWKGGKQTPLLQ